MICCGMSDVNTLLCPPRTLQQSLHHSPMLFHPWLLAENWPGTEHLGGCRVQTEARGGGDGTAGPGETLPVEAISAITQSRDSDVSQEEKGQDTEEKQKERRKENVGRAAPASELFNFFLDG